MKTKKKAANSFTGSCGIIKKNQSEKNQSEKNQSEKNHKLTTATRPKVNSFRQKRALVALVRFDSVSTLELEKIAGVRNAPELMAQLCRNGFEWDCEIFEVLDRDGNVCRPGRYKLKPESKKVAFELVKTWPAIDQI